MRLLMIEDNRALADSVRHGLEKEGFAVDLAYTGEDGEEMAFVNPYDVILLDLNLPDKDGIDILKDLRTEGNETPVIIATARDRVDQRALGLDFGADDYVTKPYELLELRARIQAVTRRFHGRTSPVVHIGSLLVNPATRQAEWNGTALELATKEFDILEYLAVCYPAVVSSEEIGEHIYNDSYDPFSSVLRVHIARLKSKLNTAAGYELMKTIRGKGYQLCVCENP